MSKSESPRDHLLSICSDRIGFTTDADLLAFLKSPLSLSPQISTAESERGCKTLRCGVIMLWFRAAVLVSSVIASITQL